MIVAFTLCVHILNFVYLKVQRFGMEHGTHSVTPKAKRCLSNVMDSPKMKNVSAATKQKYMWKSVVSKVIHLLTLSVFMAQWMPGRNAELAHTGYYSIQYSFWVVDSQFVHSIHGLSKSFWLPCCRDNDIDACALCTTFRFIWVFVVVIAPIKRLSSTRKRNG